MRRPRPTLPLLLALLAAAGCTTGVDVAECPGAQVATFQLTATRTAASCQGDSAPRDGDQACAAAALAAGQTWTGQCQVQRPVPACCFDALFPPTLPVAGAAPLSVAIAWGTLDAASFCKQAPLASPLTGRHVPAAGGDQLDVALDTSGAVLGSCASTCAVTVRQAVTGLLTRDPASGAATGFTGQLTETDSATPSATCAPCAAPCSASWTLTSIP